MICEKCKKNEAVFYYHENVNGDEKSYKLCRNCAEEMKKNGEFKEISQVSFSGNLESFFDDSFFGGTFKAMDSLFGSLFAPTNTGFISSGVEEKCPACGYNLHDISKTGKAGCPKCYDTFRRELSGVIAKIHGNTYHNGRTPKKFREKNELKNQISALESEQREAIKNENYERAAEIRDKLKNLRGNA